MDERLSDSLMMSAEQGSYPELNSTPSGSRSHIHPRHLCAHRLRTCQREDARLAHRVTPCTLAKATVEVRIRGSYYPGECEAGWTGAAFCLNLRVFTTFSIEAGPA
ncbi:hypothetical protein PGT21_029742 [Puccinia graminis f. sp. tritici]|uniref:Uncharacterized protein n=1 Tax=Puccinia graminis f. sp. tritici TaxID=56615 RepID=A0A5B0PZ18_PUCGR|nr:hypothetical protein PGT21_029742 [Puccinia graminis f. sp. tritici]KAA1109200.1 hypothetical protein PGTUg99_015682 [Puccinia graminis f. sp. tritici]